MLILRRTRPVDASPDAVFAASTDLASRPQRVPSVTRCEPLTEGPFGLGTRYRETRRLLGRETAEDFTVVACEPGRRFVTACWAAECRVEVTYAVEAAPGGTELSVTLAVAPETPKGWLAVGGCLAFRGPLGRMFATELAAVAAAACRENTTR